MGLFLYLCPMVIKKLRNKTKGYAKIGSLVRVDPKDHGSFIYVDINELDVIGVISSSGPPGSMCNITLLGSSDTTVVTPSPSNNIDAGTPDSIYPETDTINGGNV